MTTPVTRTEIADHIEQVFDGRTHDLDDLLLAARSSHARPAVLDTLAELPRHKYVQLRDLWNHLSQTPIGDPAA